MDRLPPQQAIDAATRHEDVRGRGVLVMHDVNGQAFALLPHLQGWLGAEGFARKEAGSAAAPARLAADTEGVTAQAITPRVVWDPRTDGFPATEYPAGYRRFLPVAHPVLRCLRCLAGLSELRSNDAAEALSEALVRQIAEQLAEHEPRYPASNFHVRFLYGARRRHVTPETAQALADRVLGEFGIGLADFPAMIQAQMLTELIGVGAPLQGSVTLSFAGDTGSLDALRNWKQALPATVFRELCKVNRADLIFFDRAATGVCGQLALSDAERKRTLDTIDALAALTGHRAGARRQRDAAAAAPDVPQLYEVDPVLGWRLRPGGAANYVHLGRRISMQATAEGCRPVPGQPRVGEKTFAAYGCSCVFGATVADEETFCAELQRRLPSWRVENHGVANFGQIHSFLQLSRALRWDKQDYVMFGWIPAHLLRNVADVRWIKHQSLEALPERAQLQRMTPRAYLDVDGKLRHRMVNFQRTDLAGVNMTQFGNDGYYMDQICFAIVERAAALVGAQGGQFFLATLLGRLSVRLAGLFADAGIRVIDASVDGPDYMAPDGAHPSPRAHLHYAETIHRYLSAVSATITA